MHSYYSTSIYILQPFYELLFLNLHYLYQDTPKTYRTAEAKLSNTPIATAKNQAKPNNTI